MQIEIDTANYKATVDLMNLKGHKVAMIHYQYKQWSPSVYREVLDDLGTLQGQLHELGAEDLISTIPDCDEHILKFQRMFGFEPVAVFEEETTGTQYLMTRSTTYGS